MCEDGKNNNDTCDEQNPLSGRDDQQVGTHPIKVQVHPPGTVSPNQNAFVTIESAVQQLSAVTCTLSGGGARFVSTKGQIGIFQFGGVPSGYAAAAEIEYSRDSGSGYVRLTAVTTDNEGSNLSSGTILVGTARSEVQAMLPPSIGEWQQIGTHPIKAVSQELLLSVEQPIQIAVLFRSASSLSTKVSAVVEPALATIAEAMSTELQSQGNSMYLHLAMLTMSVTEGASQTPGLKPVVVKVGATVPYGGNLVLIEDSITVWVRQGV